MEEHDTIEDFISRVKSLGEVQMNAKKATVSVNIDQQNRAQMMVESGVFPPKQFELDKTPRKLDISGFCTLPSGVMAFADSKNEEVKITHKDGTIKANVSFIAKGVSDITLIDNDHIAVSNPNANTVSIIAVDSGNVIRTLKTKSEVNGIVHRDGYIYLCVTGKGIMKINIRKEKEKQVRDDKSVDTLSRIDTAGKRLCYTSYHKNTVTVLDFKYRVIFTYKNYMNLCGPRGVSMDNHQNMFVCNYAKQNILLISRGGDKVKTVVPEDDELKDPIEVHYCVDIKSILVVSTNGHVRRYPVH